MEEAVVLEEEGVEEDLDLLQVAAVEVAAVLAEDLHLVEEAVAAVDHLEEVAVVVVVMVKEGVGEAAVAEVRVA